MKTDEFLNEMKNIINEDNMSELKKELDYLYKGIGWAEWDYFKEGLAYSTNFKSEETTDEDLEKMINASGIAKVKQVKDIKNYSDMEDFNPEDFNPDDKIILTKKPMSNQFYSESSQKNEDDLRKKLTKWGLTYGNPDAPTEKIVDKLVKDFPELTKYKKEIIDKVNAHKKKHYADYDDVAFEILTRSESSQKNEASMPLSDYKELYRMLGIFQRDIEEEYPGNTSDMMDYWNNIGELRELIKQMWDGEEF